MRAESDLPDAGACDPGLLLDLATGRLGPSETAALQEHLGRCRTCSDALARLAPLAGEIAVLKQTGLGREGAEQLWAALEQEVPRAAERGRARRAWQTLFAPLRARVAVAVAVLALLVTGAGAVLLARPEAGPGPSQPAFARAGETLAIAEVGPATAEFECGARLALASNTKARVIDTAARSAVVRLERGTVQASVPRLAPDGRFAVETTDAVVRVKGTRFTVTKSTAAFTEVSVAEGSVWVEPAGAGREPFLLRAGESARVASESAHLAALRADGVRAAAEGAYERVVELLDRYVATSSARDPEAEMLLAEASERIGQPGRAMKIYDRLTEGSSLPAQNAYAALALLHQRLGHRADAMAIWRRYLDRFGEGLYAADARRELDATPPRPGGRGERRDRSPAAGE